MKSLVKGGVLVFAATLVWQMSNFMFNVVGAHELGPSRYSILASAIGLSYLLNPVVLAVQTVASRESTSALVDDDGSQIRGITNYYLARVGLGAVGLAIVVIALSPIISGLLHLRSAALVVIFALVIPTVLASSIVRGVHQGSRRFGRYSLGTITEGLTKVCFATLLLAVLWRAPVSGMLALLISAIAGLIVNVLLLKHWPKPTEQIRPQSLPIRYSLSTFAAFGLLAVLLSVDTMAARLALPPHLAGVYAGISLGGKIAYFATTAVTAYIFPVFSNRFDQGTSTRDWLVGSIAFVAVVCAAVIGVFSVAPSLVTTVLLGPEYRAVANELSTMGLIFTIYAMTNLAVIYLLARRQRGIATVLCIAVIVEVGGFSEFHSSISDLMATLASAYGVALVGCISLGMVGLRRRASVVAGLNVVNGRPLIAASLIQAHGKHRVAGRRNSAYPSYSRDMVNSRRPVGRHRRGDRLPELRPSKDASAVERSVQFNDS